MWSTGEVLQQYCINSCLELDLSDDLPEELLHKIYIHTADWVAELAANKPSKFIWIIRSFLKKKKSNLITVSYLVCGEATGRMWVTDYDENRKYITKQLSWLEPHTNSM